MATSADQQLASSIPQPKTFAPSREDVLSTLAFFFGDPAEPEKLRDYHEHHAQTYHFPDGAPPLCALPGPPCIAAEPASALRAHSLLRPEHAHPRHVEQSHPQVP